MLRSAWFVLGYRVDAIDGEMGNAFDFYFDDTDWVIRYLVVDVGNWLSRQCVLVPVASLDQPAWMKFSFPVKLAKEHVENSPESIAQKAIGHQRWTRPKSGFGWPAYWEDSIGSFAPVTAAVQDGQAAAEESTDYEGTPASQKAEPHLRSLRVVSGYHIRATDGEIGHFEDIIVDDENWSIQYVVVDTRNWLPGGKVLLEPSAFDGIRGNEAKAYVGLECGDVKRSPAYDPSKPINRDQEGRCYDYHGRPDWV